MCSNIDGRKDEKSTLLTYHDVVQSEMRFEWNAKKRKLNLVKHKIEFEEAIEVLNCSHVFVLKDSPQIDEDRYVFIGLSKKLNILVVVACYPELYITRIISARKANKRERKFYETQL